MRGLLVLVAAAVACGEEVSSRPLEVDLQGVGFDAARVAALWFDGADRECSEFRGTAIDEASADAGDDWTPGTSERRLLLPQTASDAGVLLVFTEDASGTIIQCACRAVRFEDFESPELVVRLIDGGC